MNSKNDLRRSAELKSEIEIDYVGAKTDIGIMPRLVRACYVEAAANKVYPPKFLILSGQSLNERDLPHPHPILHDVPKHWVSCSRCLHRLKPPFAHQWHAA
jgi:hypothetical protein